MFQIYFKIAFRNLYRYRVNTIINVLGITLGISGALIIYTILKDEINFDNFHNQSSDTFRIVQHNHTADGTQFWNTTAYPLAEALREEFPEVLVTQTTGPMSMNFSAENNETFKFDETKVLFVDKDFFSVFDFKKVFNEQLWIAGNPKAAFEHPNSLILTLKTAKRYFGEIEGREEEILGKTLLINDKDLMTISGIIQDPPNNSSLLFEILIPFEFFKIHNDYQANNWSGNYQGTTFMVLSDHQELSGIVNKINRLKEKYLNPEENNRIEYVLQPYKDAHTETLYGSSPGSYVLSKGIINGLIILACFLLAIGCVNFINLATAQSLLRAKEVGVRKVLGGNKKQLFFQFMSEAFIVILIAFIISIFVSQQAIQQINEWVPIVQFQFNFDLNFFIIGIMVIAFITIITGSYPALILSRFTPVLALKNTFGLQKKGRFSLRQLLIVFQFCIAQLLIAGTIIVASQMYYFKNKDLGYNKENVITLNIPENSPEKMEAFRQKIVQYPEIEQVSFSSGPPTAFERQYGTTFRLSHEPMEMRREAEMKVLDPEYLAVYKLQLLAGSWIEEANKKEAFNGFVVNESLIDMLGFSAEEALGKTISINEGEAPIIGVVKDFHNNALQEDISPCVFLYWGTGFLDQASILVAGNINGQRMASPMDMIEKSWKEIYSDAIFSYEFLDEKLEQNYMIENMVFKASQIASIVAIFIACLGLYGLVSLVTLQRTKEFGIRKVLGASLNHLLQLLSRDFIRLVGLAILLATPFVWYFMDQWLQNFAYRIELEWWYFLGAGIFTMFIALLTVSFQSIKAALMNPVKSLRSE